MMKQIAQNVLHMLLIDVIVTNQEISLVSGMKKDLITGHVTTIYVSEYYCFNQLL